MEERKWVMNFSFYLWPIVRLWCSHLAARHAFNGLLSMPYSQTPAPRYLKLKAQVFTDFLWKAFPKLEHFISYCLDSFGLLTSFFFFFLLAWEDMSSGTFCIFGLHLCLGIFPSMYFSHHSLCTPCFPPANVSLTHGNEWGRVHTDSSLETGWFSLHGNHRQQQ